jgi:DNA-binding SARP family transcriptional activator
MMRRVRSRSVPDPVDDELPRPQLLHRLHERFRVPVVSVVAGAGFGKSTAMAQAVRHNHVRPAGVDVWVSCRPGLEDAEQLGQAILHQLQPLRAPRPPVTPPGLTAVAATVERAIADSSPLDLCIVLDDVHHLPHGSSAEKLLVELLRRLPDNGHLALLSRTPTGLPLSRLRAAGQLIELDESDLVFTAAEVQALAAVSGRPADSVAALGGWPALVRLGLVAPAGADRAFLVEEVLASLDDRRRQALLALALVGPADDASVARVAGFPLVVTELLQGVPLVTRTSDGGHVAHQLWDAALRASFPPDTLRELQLRAIDVLLELDDPPRAAPIALALGDPEALDRIALAMTRRHLNHIPVDTIRPWLAQVPAPGPAMRTLEALVLYTLDTKDHRVEALLDAVLVETAAGEQVEIEAAALGAAAVLTHARQDLGRLFALAMRAAELPVRDPLLDVLRAGITAVGCDLNGDPDGVIEALRPIAWHRVPVGAAMLTGRLYLQALWMAGRAAESIPFADTWFRGTDSYLAGLPALSRWFAGEPLEAFTDGIGVVRDDSTNDRDQFVGSCFGTMIAAARGRRDIVDGAWADGSLASLAFPNARDSAHLTYATAARYVLWGDDEAAADAYRRHLAEYPVEVALGERHLRRFPAPGYVLSPELRAYWDQAELGPDHARAISSARALLAVRDGLRPDELPPAPQIITHLPLPWTIELVARLAELDEERAVALWNDVFAVVGGTALSELARRAATGPAHLAGAARVLGSLPAVPSSTTELLVLGPMAIRRGGEMVDAPELHRARVRQLLQVLVLERVVTRDRAQFLLWPDLAPEASAKNLRVTLTHLRKALEPDRAAGTAGFHLRVDQRAIALHESQHLRVDAWEADELSRRVDEATDVASERRALAALVESWRGVPYPDLDDIAELAGVLEHVRRRHVDALLRLGELHIASGAAADAKRLAGQVLAVDPYCEQAHRLAIAADLRLDDAAALRRSVARLSEAMDELGVDVAPSTRILLHRISMQADTTSPLR